MAKAPASLKVFLQQYRIPMVLGVIGLLLPWLPRGLAALDSPEQGLLWLLAGCLFAPLGALLGFLLAWFGRPLIAQLAAILIGLTAAFWFLLLSVQLTEWLERLFAAHWQSEFTILAMAGLIFFIYKASFALGGAVNAWLLARMQQARASGPLAHLKDHQRRPLPRSIASQWTRYSLRILTFFVVFISSSMAFFVPNFSAPFFWFVLALSLLAASMAPASYTPPKKANAPLLLLWGAGALLAAAKALQPRYFGSIWESFAAVLALTAAFAGLHFLFPRATLWLRREMYTPTTRLGRGCLSVSLALLGGGGVLGASLGRRLARQIDDPNLGFALMGACLLFVAYALLHTGLAQHIYDRAERQAAAE